MYYENFNRLWAKRDIQAVEQLGDQLAEIKPLMD
jgi:hypothetical protein